MSKFGTEEAYLSAMLTFGESLLTGTTTTADFFYLNGYGNERIAAVIDAADELGIRLVMGRTFLDAEWGGRGDSRNRRRRGRALPGAQERLRRPAQARARARAAQPVWGVARDD